MPGRKPNPTWDAICERFGLNPTTVTEQKRVGKVVAALDTKLATKSTIKVNCDKWNFMFPGATLTPEALVKWWDELCAFTFTPAFPEMPSQKEFDVDQQMRCLELRGENFLRQRCKNEGFECILDKTYET